MGQPDVKGGFALPGMSRTTSMNTMPQRTVTRRVIPDGSFRQRRRGGGSTGG
jgi:hypothetical protein